ncbi:hypothetical protein [Streptomyces mangrovi]|uniref:hypothetical protein n=1 Tax=Streptomyces mangrovi TaxID=1206892 RepID=UPI00399C9A8D
MSAAEGTGAPEFPEAAPAEPVWMLRVNPLRRSRLGDPHLAGLLGKLTDAEQEVRAAADACSDALYELIAGTTGTDERGRLIALRRDIHNDRRPRAVPDPEPAAVARWRQARERRDGLRARVAETYPEAADRERTLLAGVLGDEDLRRSLALVAPEVAGSAERYRRAAAGGRIPSRVRKTERGLLQYVTRAMVRTSPLSRFTAVGLALPCEDGEDGEDGGTGGTGVAPGEVRFGGATAFVGLDRVMLDYVLGGLEPAREDLAPDTWVQLPPTSTVDPAGGRLYFLRRTDQGVRRLAAPLNGSIRPLVEATALGPRRASAVAADLAARTGRPSEEALRAVAKSVAAGILCVCRGPEDGGADFQGLLDPPDLAEPATAGVLAEIRTRLPALADSPPSERERDLARLNSSLNRLSLAANRPARILVEEDYVLPPARIATAAWRSRLDDLAAGVGLLSVFDRMHDVRALLSTAFTERFGAGAEVSLVEHAAELVGEVYRRGGDYDGTVAAGTGPADGSLDRLQDLRRSVAETLGAELDRAAERGEDLTLTATEAADLAAGLPDRFRQGHLAYGVLVQPWRDRLVFNDAYAGHGMLYGRFLGYDRALGGGALDHAARRLTAQYGEDGARVAEDLGLHRLNVNAHVPVLADGLRPDDWLPLRLAHDPGTDTLTLRDAEGRDLRVLTLGAGHPELFPPPVRLASWLMSGGRLYEDLVGRRHTAAGRDDRRTHRCPRLSVGSAVFARRRWYGGRELADAVAAGPAEHDRLLALAAWRARHGVPEEVVLKTPFDDGYRQAANESGEDVRDHRRRQKPQYVDLAAALNVRVLPRLMERRSAGYVEEALPGVSDGEHAAEWVVEIGRAPGGPFQYGGKTE